ncbi:helix-turn-helix domain-containing protein [Candidatus Clostridium stratigraminis]|uniref:Helix-turn-helix domain-containing protein n=1 Tax=Candidatus Clostridium stratigraminis TaxID=3381661 RepID=A0ABW8T575_9CLOT
MDMSNIKLRSGYLNSDFEYFHIIDKKHMEFELHYHDFNKIIIFISGIVTYLIEGKVYKLKPWDILFVNSHDLHKPIVSMDVPYERIVLWVNSSFLELHNRGNSNLQTCFELASKEKICLLRLSADNVKSLQSILFNLEASNKDNDFGNEVLKSSLFLQLMVYINRAFLRRKLSTAYIDIEYDERIAAILDYINSNLKEDLSIERLASKFYISKYFLMHKFKADTGYTLHNYIQQKRLIKASNLITEGKPITQIYLDCGFGDYSSFIRAFKKAFNLSPRDYYKTSNKMDASYIYGTHFHNN